MAEVAVGSDSLASNNDKIERKREKLAAGFEKEKNGRIWIQEKRFDISQKRYCI